MYYSRARWRVSDLFDQRTWFTQSGAFSYYIALFTTLEQSFISTGLEKFIIQPIISSFNGH